MQPAAKLAVVAEVARRSLVAYAELLDRHYRAGAMHELIASRLEAVACGTIKRLIVTCPPRHGKTRLMAQEFPTWLIGKHPERNVILASYGLDLSVESSRKARQRMSEPVFQTIFPGCRLADDDASADSWATTAGGRYRAVGVGGGLTGHGCDLLVVDDPFKDHQEAHSPTRRAAIWAWFLSVAYTRLSPGGAIVVISTRWHVDDLVGRLLDAKRKAELLEAGVSQSEQWEMLDLPALARANDPLGRAEGEPLFPERFDKQRLNAIRATLGSSLWSALYQGTPVPEGGNAVNPANFVINDPREVPQGLRWVRFWDLAGTEVNRSEVRRGEPDYTAGARCALDGDRTFWISDVCRWQLEWAKSRPRIAAIGSAERTEVGVEAVGGFKTAFSNLRELWPPDVRLREYQAENDKLTRALPWIALTEIGKVHVVNGPWVPDFLAEVGAFPAGKHDDMVDAVSGAYRMLTAPVSTIVMRKLVG